MFSFLLTQECFQWARVCHTLCQDFLTDPRENQNSLTCDQVMHLEVLGHLCDSKGTSSFFFLLIPNVLSGKR